MIYESPADTQNCSVHPTSTKSREKSLRPSTPQSRYLSDTIFASEASLSSLGLISMHQQCISNLLWLEKHCAICENQGIYLSIVLKDLHSMNHMLMPETALCVCRPPRLKKRGQMVAPDKKKGILSRMVVLEKSEMIASCML